jgi:hypothetical protein
MKNKTQFLHLCAWKKEQRKLNNKTIKHETKIVYKK